MFRKQNNGQAVNGQRVFSVGFFLSCYLKSGKRSRAVLSMYTYTHARALAPFFLFLLSYKKKLFFSFFSFFYIFSFFLFVFFCKS